MIRTSAEKHCAPPTQRQQEEEEEEVHTKQNDRKIYFYTYGSNTARGQDEKKTVQGEFNMCGKKRKKSLVKGSQDAGLMQSGISRQTLPRGSDRAKRTGQRRAGGSDRKELEEGQTGI